MYEHVISGTARCFESLSTTDHKVLDTVQTEQYKCCAKKCEN